MIPLPIYVLSLERATDRRAAMAQLCAERGLNIRFFPAVDARDPAQTARLAALPDEGEIGCFFPHDKACTLSHLDILGDFVTGTATHCLVLEDDIFIAEDLAAWLADLAWWPSGVDVVKIERWRNDGLMLALSRHGTVWLGRSIHRLFSRHTGCAGYLVTREGARAVLAGVASAGGVPTMPIDHLLFNPQASAICRGLSVAQVVPALVVQGNDLPGPSAATRPVPPDDALLRQTRKRRRLELLAVRDMVALWLRGRIVPRRIQFASHLARVGG